MAEYTQERERSLIVQLSQVVGAVKHTERIENSSYEQGAFHGVMITGAKSIFDMFAAWSKEDEANQQE